MPRLVAFGGLALLGDDGPLGGSAARGRNLALLALLARAGDAGLMREKAAAYLWSDSDEERARHSLDQALYTLRQTLGSEAFVSRATTVALDHRVVECDVVAFSRAIEAGAMDQAADLYAGPFLDGFHLPRSLEFERWVDRERSALHGDYVAALERLAQEAAAAGDHASAVARWRQLAAAEPLSSRVALGLMRALGNSGDPAGALQTAAVHASLVREEVDAAPDPAITAYVDRLRHEAESGASRAAETAAHQAVPAPHLPEPSRTSTHHQDALPGRRRSRIRQTRARLALAVAAVAILVLATGAALLSRRGSVADPVAHRVAVEPFQNETGVASLDPVGNMAADWITDGLVRTGLVQVVEADAAKGSPASVVSGRFYLTGDTVWFQARITRQDSGIVLHALDRVGVAAVNPSAALESLRQQILGAFGALYDPRLSTWARMARRPPSYATYQEFAAGLELHAVPRDLAGAAERFRHAAELDPDYVLPRLWLAWTLIMSGDYARADSVTRALAAQRERMSPVERAWHDRIRALLAGDNEASYRAARRMVELAPRSGTVMALANAALDTNRGARHRGDGGARARRAGRLSGPSNHGGPADRRR